MTLRALLLLWVSSLLLSACECQISFSACHAAGVTDLVFIGTVQSIEPIFMNRWYQNNQSPIRSLNEAYNDAQQHPSDQALARLKDTYLKIFPGLPADEKRRLQVAKSIQNVGSLLYSTLDRGMRVRLKVKTLFKQESDDDSPRRRKSRISSMSGPPLTIAASIFKSAKPISYSPITTNSARTISPEAVPGPAEYLTRARIWLIFSSTRIIRRNHPGWKDSPPPNDLILIRSMTPRRSNHRFPASSSNCDPIV